MTLRAIFGFCLGTMSFLVTMASFAHLLGTDTPIQFIGPESTRQAFIVGVGLSLNAIVGLVAGRLMRRRPSLELFSAIAKELAVHRIPT